MTGLPFFYASQAVDSSTSRVLWLHHETKCIIGFDVAVNLSSPDSFCLLFDITSEHSVELKWLMLNKHKRWFHSSRVNFPLVSMSASWFLVSMYLIWIFGSKLIWSNNQSRTTLWVLETCLIGGLLPFKIILITASLSSNTTTKLPDAKVGRFREQSQHYPKHWWLLEIACVCSTTGLSVLSRTETTRSHKSRAGIPSNLNPASIEMISDSVELHANIHVVIGIRVVLCHPLVHNFSFSTSCPNSHLVVMLYQFIIIFTCSYFAHVLHLGNTSFEMWYLHSLHCLAVLST